MNDIPGRVEWRVQQPTPNEGSADANGGARTECDDLVKEESQSPPASHSKVIYAHTPEDGEFRLTLHGDFKANRGWNSPAVCDRGGSGAHGCYKGDRSPGGTQGLVDHSRRRTVNAPFRHSPVPNATSSPL